MAPLVSTIEVTRLADRVFAYVTDPSRFSEWQHSVVSGQMDGTGTAEVGSRCITTRRIGFGERPSTSEVTRMQPPRRWAVHGVDGPIRAVVHVEVEPLDGDARSRVTIALDFEGHGIGKVLVPLVVRRQARREMPDNLRALNERLEREG